MSVFHFNLPYNVLVLSDEGRSEIGSVYTQLTHCSSLDGHPVKYCSSLEPGHLGKSKQKPSPSIFIKSNSLSIDLDDGKQRWIVP